MQKQVCVQIDRRSPERKSRKDCGTHSSADDLLFLLDFCARANDGEREQSNEIVPWLTWLLSQPYRLCGGAFRRDNESPCHDKAQAGERGGFPRRSVQRPRG